MNDQIKMNLRNIGLNKNKREYTCDTLIDAVINFRNNFNKGQRIRLKDSETLNYESEFWNKYATPKFYLGSFFMSKAYTSNFFSKYIKLSYNMIQYNRNSHGYIPSNMNVSKWQEFDIFEYKYNTILEIDLLHEVLVEYLAELISYYCVKENKNYEFSIWKLQSRVKRRNYFK